MKQKYKSYFSQQECDLDVQKIFPHVSLLQETCPWACMVKQLINKDTNSKHDKGQNIKEIFLNKQR